MRRPAPPPWAGPELLQPCEFQHCHPPSHQRPYSLRVMVTATLEIAATVGLRAALSPSTSTSSPRADNPGRPGVPLVYHFSDTARAPRPNTRSPPNMTYCCKDLWSSFNLAVVSYPYESLCRNGGSSKNGIPSSHMAKCAKRSDISSWSAPMCRYAPL